MVKNLDMLKRMVACVYVDDKQNGTAFLIDEWHVVTALHVLKRKRNVTLAFQNWREFEDDGKRVAKLAWRHPEGLDIAVLRLDRECPVELGILPWRQVPDPGAEWYTFGFPLDVPAGHASTSDNKIEDSRRTIPKSQHTVMQLKSEIAKEDLGGYSGSPCVVDGAIAGILANQLYRKDKPLFDTLYALPMELLKDSGIRSPSPMLLMDIPTSIPDSDWTVFRQQLIRTNLKSNRGKYIGDDERFIEPFDVLNNENLLALNGSFGRGKTRMGEELAWRARKQYPDGIWVVELEHVAVAEGILPAIASAMGMEKTGTITIKDLVNMVGHSSVLLILDACEKLVEETMAIGLELSNQCPNLKLLLTTQDIARDFYNIHVPVLKYPPQKDVPDIPSVIEKYEAVRFLVYQSSRRAGARLKITDSNAASIAELCRLVQGVPLQLMLVAGCLLSTDVDSLITKLKDSDASIFLDTDENLTKEAADLRATLAVCSSELDEFQNELLTRLAVFRGPFTEDAARAIAKDCYRSGDMNTVIDHSFVERIRDRDNKLYYLMLSSTRQFYWQRVKDTPLENTLCHLHLTHYLETVQLLNKELKGGEQGTSLNQMEKEHENILAAIDYAWKVNRTNDGALLASQMRRFWFLRGYYDTGRQVLETAIAHLSDDELQLRALVLSDAGILARMQSNYKLALEYLNKSVEIASANDFQHIKGTALNAIGILHCRRKEWELAEKALNSALVIGENIGDKNLQAWVYNGLTNAAIGLKKHEEARNFAIKSFELKKQLDDKRGMAMSQERMGVLEREAGNIPMAKKLFESALATRRELGYRSGVAETLCQLADIAVEEQKFPVARDFLLEALNTFMALQDRTRLAALLEILQKFLVATKFESKASNIASARNAVLREIGVKNNGYTESAAETMLGKQVAWHDTVIETWGWLQSDFLDEKDAHLEGAG